MDEYMVPLAQIKKIIEKSEAVGAEDVSFSFVIGSLFPEAYENMKNILLKERLAGYHEAVEEMKERLDGFLNEN